MLISRQWLSDYVDFDELSREDFSELITTRVAEVDETYRIGTPVESAVVVEIKHAEPHPERAKLTVCRLQTGGDEVQVLCGAPNCSVGQFAVYLPPGTWMYRPGSRVGEDEERIEIEAREIAGVESFGVLVSEAELGLTGAHEGILVLSESFLRDSVPHGSNVQIPPLIPGEKLSRYIPGEDVLLEIDNKSLTHRPDLWSHFGFAREIGAILGRPLKKEIDSWADDNSKGAELFSSLGSEGGLENEFSVEIEPQCGCRRFTALEFRNVRSVPSPFWMRRRLFSIGAGVRSFLIDLSNYVMHDIGQPNHAYDADRLRGKTIYARLAREGEHFTGLDDEERTLTTQDIAIADEQGSVALGGVIGGRDSSVTDDTTRLLLEAANFDPVRVRKTSKCHQLRTDASNRFEKSLSAYAAPVGVQRFTELLLEVLPEAEVVGPPRDAFVERPETVSVCYRPEYIRERLGSEISDKQIEKILISLGFDVQDSTSGGSQLMKVPYYRATRDVSIEDDLVEEVGRVFGYENIPETAPKIESQSASPRPVIELEYSIQDLLRAMGYSETYNYSFFSPSRAKTLGYDESKSIRLKNPLDSNYDTVRTTLIPGMAEQLEKNRRQSSLLALFELGRAYETEPLPERDSLSCRRTDKQAAAHERRLLCIGYSSGKKDEDLEGLSSPVVTSGGDFFSVIATIERISGLVTREKLTVSPIESGERGEAWDYRSKKRWMHPYRAASLSLSGFNIGVVAEVYPGVLEDFPGRAVMAELDLELLYEAGSRRVQFKPLPKYPDSFFEMSVVMPKRCYYRELEELLMENVEKKLLRGIEVVAVYEGQPLKEDQKSVSVKLYLGSDERTLSGEELSQVQNKLIAAVQASRFDLRA